MLLMLDLKVFLVVKIKVKKLIYIAFLVVFW